MASYGGPVYSPRVQDKSADYIYQGMADLWGGIGKGISAAIGNTIDERQKSKALQARFDMLEQEGYTTPEMRDKFYKGSTSQQAGIMAELMARMDRAAAEGRERESARRFDLGYDLDKTRLGQQQEQFAQRMGFDRMQAGQDADYRNAQLEEARRRQDFEERPVTWEQLNGTNYMVNPKGSALPLAEKGQDPGFVPLDASGAGYFRDAEGRAVDPGNILLPRNGAPMPAVPAGGPEGTLFPGMGTGTDGVGELPGNPQRASGPSVLVPPYVPLLPKAEPVAPRVQTAKVTDTEGNEQLVQLLPDGTYRPLRPAGEAGGSPAAPGAARPAGSALPGFLEWLKAQGK